ncbi:MAG: glycosyltransferase family 8 protein [Alphaproteobacteria bacterium]|nr:glycosyltransferase family 8 protein [Alphaproteobacteria bacterium]
MTLSLKIKKWLVDYIAFRNKDYYTYQSRFLMPKINPQTPAFDKAVAGGGNRRINVAFGLDNNYWRFTGVAITSLLAQSEGTCVYDIYCLVPPNFTQEAKWGLAGIVQRFSPESKITFIHVGDNNLRHRYPSPWAISSYYRLMLPAILPNVDKIIYADSDAIFCRDLASADDIPLGQNLIAAVRDNTKGFVNSGFLIMNLRQMRQENTYPYFMGLLPYNFQWPDQSILNICCKGRILHLPWKYNFRPLLLVGELQNGTHTYSEYADLKDGVVFVHWCGPKPWNERGLLGHLWQKFADMSGLF